MPQDFSTDGRAHWLRCCHNEGQASCRLTRGRKISFPRQKRHLKQPRPRAARERIVQCEGAALNLTQKHSRAGSEKSAGRRVACAPCASGRDSVLPTYSSLLPDSETDDRTCRRARSKARGASACTLCTRRSSRRVLDKNLIPGGSCVDAGREGVRRVQSA